MKTIWLVQKLTTILQILGKKNFKKPSANFEAFRYSFYYII